ncbi:MAG: hypothetical protein ETSY1_44165 [Candidatus Entotheonella factor]|uniref:Uncharacterized protein n=1 Tax=Entotheonella factor TaxID=1429438 RepID=W4L4U2_ENTF1|nr:MAG: hypothetical protein ETSY1_44165 [Candidatus Entotheonella factor]
MRFNSALAGKEEPADASAQLRRLVVLDLREIFRRDARQPSQTLCLDALPNAVQLELTAKRQTVPPSAALAKARACLAEACLSR